jgi:hypothetical protein
MSDALDTLATTAEAIKPKEPEPKPEPTFTLSRLLTEIGAVREVTQTGDEALVMLIARLMDVPLYDENSMEAVRAAVLS